MEKPQAYALHVLVATLLLLSRIAAETVVESDKQALLDFANKIHYSRRYLNWNEHSSVCKNWTGITCSEDGNRVIAARLPAVGFHGPIPANTLSRLSALQVLSLRSNRITGTFPLDLGNLRNLTFLYLQHNNLSGTMPLDFSVWRNLTIVNLSNNGFNGSIPRSLSSLSQLVALNLANNSLCCEVPDLNLPNLQLLNLSYNDLVGSVPKSLQRFPKSVFLGNNESLIDYSVSISVAPHERAKNGGKLCEKALLGIIIVGSVIGILGFGVMLFVYVLRRKNMNGFPSKLDKGKAISGGKDDKNKLVFFEGCKYAFDLEDLLRASAEVLGKGSFGMAYKAILEDSTTVVVKRLKDVNVGKKEFKQQMNIIGSIKHENVVELKAYYYSKDEKLMVYDYYSQGSVDSILHGKPVDWITRVNIAVGAAKGIARIHIEKLVHGNIKSSNIFLNPQQLGCVSDLGLVGIMRALPCAAGNHAPEVTDTSKATQPSDVYSFGVILLQLLTGKSPVHTINGDVLVRWVLSVVREEWTAEVFDAELLRYPNIDEQLVEMLQIALACVARVAQQRPKMPQVVDMLEGLDSRNRISSEEKAENLRPSPSSSGV